MTDNTLEAVGAVIGQMIDEAYGIAPDKHFSTLLAQAAIAAYEEAVKEESDRLLGEIWLEIDN